MVDNQNKYNKQRLKILIGGFFAVFVSFFLPKKKGRIILNSHFNDNFDFNSKFLFLYMLKKGYDVWYVINNDKYREVLINEYGHNFIETNSFRGKIFALRAKIWFISAFELPVGGIFLKASRTIVHLTHGSLIKNVGLLEKDISLIKNCIIIFLLKLIYLILLQHLIFLFQVLQVIQDYLRKKFLLQDFPETMPFFQKYLVMLVLLKMMILKLSHL